MIRCRLQTTSHSQDSPNDIVLACVGIPWSAGIAVQYPAKYLRRPWPGLTLPSTPPMPSAATFTAMPKLSLDLPMSSDQ